MLKKKYNKKETYCHKTFNVPVANSCYNDKSEKGKVPPDKMFSVMKEWYNSLGGKHSLRLDLRPALWQRLPALHSTPVKSLHLEEVLGLGGALLLLMSLRGHLSKSLLNICLYAHRLLLLSTQ